MMATLLGMPLHSNEGVYEEKKRLESKLDYAVSSGFVLSFIYML